MTQWQADGASRPPVLISLTAYGADLALRDGQAALARIAAAAGADGVEFRGELQRGYKEEVSEQREAAGQHGLSVVWSSPEGLWNDAGSLDAAALDRAFTTALALGATRVKMSLGGYREGTALEALLPWLRHDGIELVVENDQTAQAGTVPPLRDFFARITALGESVPMTFDMGNWHWTGEDPLDAAQVFGAGVATCTAKACSARPPNGSRCRLTSRRHHGAPSCAACPRTLRVRSNSRCKAKTWCRSRAIMSNCCVRWRSPHEHRS